MKKFPLRVLILCVFLPPIFYLLTISLMERWFQRQENAAIHQVMIQDLQALYEGRYSVKEEIRRNIDAHLKGSLKQKMGVRIHVLVKTRDDVILYPSQLELDLGKGPEALDGSRRDGRNYLDVASENFRVLNEGLDHSVQVEIRHGGWLANLTLLFYLSLSLLILQKFVRKAFQEKETLEVRQEGQIRELVDQLEAASIRLEEVASKEKEYEAKIRKLQEDKETLAKDVDDLLGEMERTEEGLESQRRMREEMEAKILTLNEELEQLKTRIKRSRKKKKGTEETEKRFKVLYKNLLFTERALEGFQELTGEFQLKAEEVVYRLNQDDSQVTVRRKVFGKGGKLNVLEADFSYSGRIYFQKNSQGKIRVMAIGTKNTQEQDLAYLEATC